jgi:hypothetical protein
MSQRCVRGGGREAEARGTDDDDDAGLPAWL